MTAAVLCCALAGLTFLPPVEAQGLWVGGPKPLTAEPLANYRPADLDGDGAPELLFADRVWLQRGGWFPEEARPHADSIVVGFAEQTWPRLLRDWCAGRLLPEYRHLGPADVAGLPIPRRDLQKSADKHG